MSVCVTIQRQANFFVPVPELLHLAARIIFMTTALRPCKPAFYPATGPIGDVGQIFRRLGGLSRLDVVFSMLGVACVAFWSCLMSGKRKATSVAMKPAVCLLTYIPSDPIQGLAE